MQSENGNQKRVADLIFKAYEKKTDQPRIHLGASEIGKPCDKALWYSFRWATIKKYPGRILRLFSTGVRAESRFFDELKSIGATVYDRSPETGQQIKFESFGGHFGGSCDAVAQGIPYEPDKWAIVECKTHSSKSFADLVKQGVQKAKPEHYAQMQVYMGLSQGIERALYIAENKDNDDLYDEWVEFNREAFTLYLTRANAIVNLPVPPLGVSTDPSWFQCKFCEHKSTCHKESVAQVNCRTCSFSTPKENGTWYCSAFKKTLSVQDQINACRSHVFIPHLVTIAEAIDGGDDFIVYETDKKTKFANVAEGVKTEYMSLSSRELSGISKHTIENEAVKQLKSIGAEIVNDDI